MMKKNMKFMLGWLSVLLLLFSCPTYAQEQDYLKKKIDVTYAAAAMKEILTDLTKKTQKYAVYDKYTVDPTDTSCTSQITNGKKIVTLITCTDDSKQRVIVQAEAI